jgi:hypothetical protein
MLAWFKAWRLAKVRLIGKDTYIRFTPNFGFSVPWFKNRKNGRRRRIRWARHHGLQLMEWNNVGRWIVAKQILGHSTVRGESFLPGTRKERIDASVRRARRRHHRW